MPQGARDPKLPAGSTGSAGSGDSAVPSANLKKKSGGQAGTVTGGANLKRGPIALPTGTANTPGKKYTTNYTIQDISKSVAPVEIASLGGVKISCHGAQVECTVSDSKGKVLGSKKLRDRGGRDISQIASSGGEDSGNSTDTPSAGGDTPSAGGETPTATDPGDGLGPYKGDQEPGVLPILFGAIYVGWEYYQNGVVVYFGSTYTDWNNHMDGVSDTATAEFSLGSIRIGGGTNYMDHCVYTGVCGIPDDYKN